MRCTALVTRNSLAYLGHVFALGRARQPFVNVPDLAFGLSFSELQVADSILPEEGGGWFSEPNPLVHEDLPAQVTFTSGTEGQPKGIVLTYANLADTAARIIAEMGLTEEVREYVGVPVTYSFGLGRIRAISAVGGHAYLPERGFDLGEFATMLRSGAVNALSVVPTLLRLVLATPEVIGEAGARLRWMEIGSQSMSAAEKKAVRALFPNARIVQHYGLTEASRSTFLVISADDKLESVGRPVGQTEVAIGPEGHIRIRGPHVARHRLEAAGLSPLCDADGWFETSDLGQLKDGYLYFEGRADDVINCGGLKVSPDRLESLIRDYLGENTPIVATKVPDSLRGEGILVVTDSPKIALEDLRKAALDALKTLGLDPGRALHVQQASIPRTGTGKPIRRTLTQNFVSQAAPTARTSTAAWTTSRVFELYFPGQPIRATDTFESLGGDSLTYIQFSMEFERRLGPLPRHWEAMSVAQLENLVAEQKGGFWRRMDSATLTRAFFMTAIVALHLDAFMYSLNYGAAYFLYMLAGHSLARFQVPEIVRTGRVGTLFGTIVRFAIATVLSVTFMQVWAWRFELKPLLLISNFFNPHQYKVAFYYFAEIYIQLLLLAALLFSVGPVRRAFAKSPVVFSAALLLVSYGGRDLIELYWDTNYIYHRTPHWYAWTFAAGMLMASGQNTRLGRILALILVTIVVVSHFGISSASYYLLGGCVLLLYLPELVVPAPFKTLISTIAGASMFMYLSHYQVKSLTARIFGEPMPWTSLFAAMIMGWIFQQFYLRVERAVRTWMGQGLRTTPPQGLGGLSQAPGA